MTPAEMRQLLERWARKEETFKRDVEDDIFPFLQSRNALFLYGPRRSGKSTVARRLVWAQPKRVKARYVNLEDPAIEGTLSVSLLDEFGQGLGGKDFLVLDEVQAIAGWEKWVRRAVDTRQCRLVVTGSSAKLLSSEFASTLGGRGLGFQVLPLSFKEFSAVKTPDFGQYLQIGGYPDVVLNPASKDKLLESYFELALIKDVVARYGVRNAADLRTLALYLLTNSGKLTSLKQLRSILGLSFDTIRSFIGYLESAFLVFQVPFFSYSLKESLARARKVYAWDAGMQAYASKSFSPDLGRKAETAVAFELKRRGFDLYYWQGKGEVDFIARKNLEIVPFNVSYSARVAGRELEGIAEFCREFNARQANVLYLGKNGKETMGNTTINLVNLEEWLLARV